MNGLLPNARRALLRPANPRDYTHTASRIIGATLPVTIASTYSATAQWYVIRYAVSHHNHQGCITISNLFPFLLLTLRHRWSVYVATPFHPHLTYSIHRNSLDNHGTSQPLRWCRQSEPFIFIEPGSANNNFLRPAAFAQRTRKARLLLTCGAIHLVPPSASCGEERRMCAVPLRLSHQYYCRQFSAG